MDISFTNLGLANVHFWYRSGTVCGYGGSSAGWTELGTQQVTITFSGDGNYTHVPLPGVITIPAGEVYGLYVYTLGGGPGRVRYYGTVPGGTCGVTTPIQPNSDLSLSAGYGVSAPTSAFGGTLIAERHFAGTIYYTTGGAYNVYRDGASIATNVAATSYTDAGFDASVSHTWEVTTVCGSGESNSVGATENACPTVNIEEIVSDNFTIYPNPTKGQLSIRNYQLGITNVEIYDVAGRYVQQFPIPNSQLFIDIDISHLAKGVYYLKIGNETVKVVKE
jgi:hypothetical protein